MEKWWNVLEKCGGKICLPTGHLMYVILSCKIEYKKLTITTSKNGLI